MKKTTDEDKPLLVINRKKGFIIILYDIFYMLWMSATAIVGYLCIQLDNVIPNITGYILVIFTPYAYFCMYNLRQIDCYEDYLVIKRSLCSQTIYYNKLKDYKQLLQEP
ncbi:hypothetical protein CBLAS_0786 [Campylobacter blaseri]|uniref:Uncharacterized protein n=1 Tax=Campylobacter blaseri TaxID=2042961 RepID=A0A2P8R2E6_9BACT|nr:hypothetical protein [Campylobacter blaseri]PSM52675.1 hypothetical protein CQ405_02785 [Campylobacter blaseri]PSM54323.1 hypothetical protein CRN67_02785 [Campylobacter blaseri]QKF85975.1 hypothetical protein CBLAS_0786 [Campylobacter blaseri]